MPVVMQRALNLRQDRPADVETKFCRDNTGLEAEACGKYDRQAISCRVAHRD